MKNDTDLFKCKNMIDKDKIIFPLTINKEIIDKLLIKKLFLLNFGQFQNNRQRR